MKWVAILLVACTKTTPSTTPEVRDDAPTPLQIVVLDDYSSKPSCDGVAPQQIEVMIDGASAGIVEVPCRTKTAMPPPQIVGPTVTVPAGKHTVVARERGVGHRVAFALELPAIEESDDGTETLATKLPIWVHDSEIEIFAPRVSIDFDNRGP